MRGGYEPKGERPDPLPAPINAAPTDAAFHDGNAAAVDQMLDDLLGDDVEVARPGDWRVLAACAAAGALAVGVLAAARR